MRLPRNSLVPALVAVFLLSGLSGLIYQVAWQRLLTVHYGVGAVSITLIVSVYMFGLGVGSLLGGRLAERAPDPYLVYAVVEVALGIAGFASFPVILALGRLTVGSPPVQSFVSLFAFLAVPTILMGISLPLLTAIFMDITGRCDPDGSPSNHVGLQWEPQLAPVLLTCGKAPDAGRRSDGGRHR